MTWVLYGTSHCHLCTAAETILRAVAQTRPLTWVVMDIALDDDLMALYADRIPVLTETTSQQVLAWPFSPLDVLRFWESLHAAT